jgi:Histone H1-like protein Hc1
MPITYTNLTEHVNTFVTEVEKFNTGNKSAGTRARKALQELTKAAKTLRVAIQEEKNAAKTTK